MQTYDRQFWDIFVRVLIGCLVGVIVGGCAPNATTFTYHQPDSGLCEVGTAPKLVSDTANLFVWSYQGRLYVFGSKESSRDFKKVPESEQGFLEVGTGPSGEDVIFERDAAHPQLTEELREHFRRTPKLLYRVGRDYSVWKRDDRFFILGPNPAVEDVFVRTGELIISKTFFNAGPQGETVVVEANKSRSRYADMLVERFNLRPVLIEKHCPDYFVWKQHGRLVVLGSPESSLRLETGRILPDTKAYVGIGPQGETVAFETDSRHPGLQRRLLTTFFGKGKIPAWVLQQDG